MKTEETEIAHYNDFGKNHEDVERRELDDLKIEDSTTHNKASAVRTFASPDVRTVVRSHQQLLRSPSACSELYGWGLESGYNLGLGLRARPGVNFRWLTVLLANGQIDHRLFLFVN